MLLREVLIPITMFWERRCSYNTSSQLEIDHVTQQSKETCQRTCRGPWCLLYYNSLCQLFCFPGFSEKMSSSPLWLCVTILCLATIGIISNLACFIILTYKRRSSKFHNLLKVNKIKMHAFCPLSLSPYTGGHKTIKKF